MSPEQARGEHADTRSDIFSFGCVLYEMLAARRAFASASRIETLHAVLKEHPPDLTRLRSDVSQSLNRVVRRCLEKAPESRFQTARDLVFALENLAPGSEPTPAPSRAAPARRARGTAIVIVAAVALLAVGAAWWWTRTARTSASGGRLAGPGGRGRRACWPCCRSRTSRAAARDILQQGMTQEVTSQLSKLSALRVVGSTAVAQFKDPRSQLSALAKELGIGSAVTGTVREQGTRVRVNVELIDALSGQRDLVRAIRPGRRRCLRGAERHRGAGRQGAQCQRDARRTGAHRETPDIVGRGVRAVRSSPNRPRQDRRRPPAGKHRSAEPCRRDRPAICRSLQ